MLTKFVADLIARCICAGRKYASSRVKNRKSGDTILEFVCRWENTRKCPFCGKPYVRAVNLRQHLLSEHEGQISTLTGELISKLRASYSKTRELHNSHTEVIIQCSNCNTIIARGKLRVHTWHGGITLGRILRELGVGELCPHCGSKLGKTPKKIQFT